MITKLIENELKTTLKDRVNGLLDYVKNPEQKRAHNLSNYIHQIRAQSYSVNEVKELITEKCVYFNSRNFLDDEHEQQKREMIQTASLNSQTDDPIVHFVYSFKQYEIPRIAEIEEQIDIFSKHLGSEELQMQYALHLDTDNAHCHVIVNKIHPFLKNKHQQHKCVDLGEGWIINSLHRAIAEIEAIHSFSSEPNPLFIYNFNTKQCDKNPCYLEKEFDKKLISKILDAEYRHQQKSQIRSIIQENSENEQIYHSYINHHLEQVLQAVHDWSSFHQELARRGLSYEKKRNGAVFKLDVGPDSLYFKASVFCNKSATLSKLIQRFGKFEYPSQNVIVKKVDLSASITIERDAKKSPSVHPYHLFEPENYIIKELHNIYLIFKEEKEQISRDSKDQIQSIKFNQQYYNHFKDKIRQKLYADYLNVDKKTINTLLEYEHAYSQEKLRKYRIAEYSVRHALLQEKIEEELNKLISKSLLKNSHKITSYSHFLNALDQTHPLVMQQKYLLDQRQSNHFITCANQKFEAAQIIYDIHEPTEPIALANRYGIQLFSNYSIDRIKQCLQLLPDSVEKYAKGETNFIHMFQEVNTNNNITDINPKRFLPNLTEFSEIELKICFAQLYSRLNNKEHTSTTLIKTNLLLHLCHLSADTIQKYTQHFLEKNKSVMYTHDDINNLNIRCRNIYSTQPKQLIKQSMNSNEIDLVWQIYFELKAKIHDPDAIYIQNSHDAKEIPALSLECIPILHTPKIYSKNSEEFKKLEKQMLDRFLHLREIQKRNKNSLRNEQEKTIDSSKVEPPNFSRQYKIEYYYGHKIYIDDHITAFIEAPHTSKIHVLSNHKQHILDALLLAQQRYGIVYVQGEESFKKQVIELAQQYKVDIVLDHQLSTLSLSSSCDGKQEQVSPYTQKLNLENRDPTIPFPEDKNIEFYLNQKTGGSSPSSELNQTKNNENNFDLH